MARTKADGEEARVRDVLSDQQARPLKVASGCSQPTRCLSQASQATFQWLLQELKRCLTKLSIVVVCLHSFCVMGAAPPGQKKHASTMLRQRKRVNVACAWSAHSEGIDHIDHETNQANTLKIHVCQMCFNRSLTASLFPYLPHTIHHSSSSLRIENDGFGLFILRLGVRHQTITQPDGSSCCNWYYHLDRQTVEV